ncbi:ECF transporter S component [Niallia nealsonii]|uniref:ECF transporter S component n=1 Tax=Niallia nealsonii TaxID=115979 RepID=A0A2N0Z2D8_9BACI|nr:ECF transporter S component [Niallia nealsonii]PKG23676.1 ECF transporter S component [Niallia nealsonii]
MISRKISVYALFIALSAVGAALKIPSSVGSIGLDSFPSLIAGVLLGGISGGIIAGIGHILSASLGGFPLGPFHVVIGLEMFLLVVVYSWLHKKYSIYIASIMFIIANSVLLPLPFLYVISEKFYFAAIPSLFIAAVLNGGVAAVLLPRLQSIKMWGKSRE